MGNKWAIKHCEYKAVTQCRLFVNETAPGHSTNISTAKIPKAQNKSNCLCLDFSLFSEILKFLQIVCLLNTGLEHSRFNHVFELPNNFIFGMLYPTI